MNKLSGRGSSFFESKQKFNFETKRSPFTFGELAKTIINNSQNRLQQPSKSHSLLILK